LSATDRSEFEAVVANRTVGKNTFGERRPMVAAEIMRATGKAKAVIWRWQERFRDEGPRGRWHDKTRPAQEASAARRVPRLQSRLQEISSRRRAAVDEMMRTWCCRFVANLVPGIVDRQNMR